jgi:hypothetical protein
VACSDLSGRYGANSGASAISDGGSALLSVGVDLSQSGCGGGAGRVRINGTVTTVTGAVNAETDYRCSDPLVCTPWLS